MQMATGAPPNAELHPMRALFLIPKDPAPRLEDSFSAGFRRFVERCLQKVLPKSHGLPHSHTLRACFCRGIVDLQRSSYIPHAPIHPGLGFQGFSRMNSNKRSSCTASLHEW